MIFGVVTFTMHPQYQSTHNIKVQMLTESSAVILPTGLIRLPILQATTSNEIACCLTKCENEKFLTLSKFREDVGLKSHIFVKEAFSSRKAYQTYLEAINKIVCAV